MTINQNPGLNKPDRVTVTVHNAEATLAIGVGAPVVLVMNGTNDGLDVVLPSTSASLQKINGLRYGVNTKSLNAGDFGSAVIFGFHPSVLLLRQSRSSSTVSWATEAARSVGEYLTIDTVNNMWITTVSTFKVVTNATTDTLAVQTLPDVVLGQTLASYAGSASATSDTRTAITAAVKGFVRMMA